MITYPLNNIDYTAEDAELFHCTRNSGIWAKDSFSISVTGADNNVTIGKGIAWINNEEFSGKVSALKSAKIIDLGIADGVYPRIDVIAIQYSANNNATDVVIKKGTPAMNPVRPAIVRSGAVYELYLASIYRPAGATAITASNITDLRMDKTVCGLMADSVTSIDTSAINAQVKALIASLEAEIESVKDTSGLMFESEWVDNGAIPISKGGTGSTSASEARTKLGLDGKLFTQYAINSINIDNTGGNWTVDISETGHGAIPMQWVNVTQTTGAHFIVQTAIKCDISQSASGRDQRMWIRDKYASGVWSNWKEVLTENRGVQMVKLWQNARPTSEFAAQSISVANLGSYDLFLVEYYYNTGLGSIYTSIIAKDIEGSMQMFTNMAAAYKLLFCGRDVTFNTSTNKIVFEDARNKAVDSAGAGTINNTRIIPIRIYGIKGVQ